MWSGTGLYRVVSLQLLGSMGWGVLGTVTMKDALHSCGTPTQQPQAQVEDVQGRSSQLEPQHSSSEPLLSSSSSLLYILVCSERMSTSQLYRNYGAICTTGIADLMYGGATSNYFNSKLIQLFFLQLIN